MQLLAPVAVNTTVAEVQKKEGAAKGEQALEIDSAKTRTDLAAEEKVDAFNDTQTPIDVATGVGRTLPREE